jgi:hypothetical protein
MARENKCQRPHTAGYPDPGGETLRLAMLPFGLSLSLVPVESEKVLGALNPCSACWSPRSASASEASAGLIIARERHIRDHRAEISAVQEHGAKLVTLAAEDAEKTEARDLPM